VEVSGIGPAEQQPTELRWDASGGSLEQIGNAYRRGDPLSVIATSQHISLDRVVAALMPFYPIAELQRAKSVRQRSLTTSAFIRENRAVMDMLLDAGIDLAETPKVLRAHGFAIDVDVAVELVLIPGINSVGPEPARLSRLAGDRLSLLYIAGKHHGIQPDYQLALTQLPLQEIAALRALLEPDFLPRRIAEFLAVAEATKNAIGEHKITSLSFSDYAALAEKERQQWEPFTLDASAPWPVPAKTLLSRFAHGFWDEALVEVGLEVPYVSRFTEDETSQALHDFNDECIGSGHPRTVDSYDRWGFSEASARNNRPSAMEVIRRYGSWASALEVILTQVNNGEPGPGKEKEEVHYVDYDSGWGTLEELENWENQQDNDWRTAEKLIRELINAMPIDSFLHIHYGQFGQGHAMPYARATLGLEGVRCEIVSADGLSPRQWPLDPHYLAANGWSAPYADVPSWHRAGVTRADAPAQILRGLRLGRHPVEATDLRWTVGRVPDGPGPAEGVTLSAALHGTVQSLGNAAQP
jgi:hypothetical protein